MTQDFHKNYQNTQNDNVPEHEFFYENVFSQKKLIKKYLYLQKNCKASNLIHNSFHQV